MTSWRLLVLASRQSQHNGGEQRRHQAGGADRSRVRTSRDLSGCLGSLRWGCRSWRRGPRSLCSFSRSAHRSHSSVASERLGYWRSPKPGEGDGTQRTGGAEVIRDGIGPYPGIDALDRGSSHACWVWKEKSADSNQRIQIILKNQWKETSVCGRSLPNDSVCGAFLCGFRSTGYQAFLNLSPASVITA